MLDSSPRPIMRDQEVSKGEADKTWSIEVGPINGPEDLQETSGGSDLQVVQLKPGKLQGSITRFGIGNLGISVGQFNSAIRTRGLLSRENVVIGTILAREDLVSSWWSNARLSDVGIVPPGADIDNIYGGGGAYLRASIAVPELVSMLDGEHRLADPEFWNTKRLYHTDPLIGDEILQRLKGIVSGIERKRAAPTAQAADFARRSIIECLVMSLVSALPPDKGLFGNTGARLVSEAENYVDAAGKRPVHISELCSALKVSRRSFHRAFAETLGIGPVAYLRRRRLSAIRSALKQRDPATFSIADLAFENGFPEPGRFTAYYRAHFGEAPSETYRSKGIQMLTPEE